MDKKQNKPNRGQLSSIQWKLLVVQWKIVVVITTTFFVSILIGATLIQSSPILSEHYNKMSNVALFSNTFFSISFIAALFIFFISSVVSFLYSYPFSKYIRNRIEKLVDAATMFTRGKLTTMVKYEGDDEFAQLSEKFNAMAEHYEKQVVSLQKLLNENSLLIEQAEQAASLEERRKLARDLHDAVSQQLFAISMTMAALPKLIEKDQTKAKLILNNVEKMVNNAQQELRALIMHLRPVTLDGKTFKEGIQSLLEELKVKNSHLNFKWENQLKSQLPSRIEDQLFRIIQEVISNMLRHSQANTFEIKTFEKDERMFIILEDDGIGFHVDEMDKSGSYGLMTMKERMIEIGGHFKLISYPNKGTKVELIIRLDKR